MHDISLIIRDCVVHPKPVAKSHRFLSATLEVSSESPYLAELTVRDTGDLVFQAEIPVEALGDLMLAAGEMVRRADAAAT